MSNKRASMPIVAEKHALSGDEDQSDDNSLAVPLKRKRGRPNTTGKVAVPKKAVVPRGRGRPRKIRGMRGWPKKSETVDEPEVENGHSSVGEVDDAPNLTPEKGRGRPKSKKA